MNEFAITSAATTYTAAATKTSSKSTSKASQNDNATTSTTVKEDTAAVYEKSSATTTTKTTNKAVDQATIDQLKADTAARQQQLVDLVRNMITKQGGTFNKATNIYEALRSGKLEVSQEVSDQAKEDISEDGYWGVKQTSDRLVSFAQALSGNDPTKADKLIEAVKKGFKEATKDWGAELPDICKDTVDTTIKKLEEWRDSINQ